ncbi:MAG: prolipoprotein diacylglyceryl transferase [Spirochaetales bacterium]|nr:prolipoprotein diacylglyceryl transferase [Spirochaetales bacterium]
MFPIHLNLGFRVFYFYEGFYFLIAIVIGVVWAMRRVKKAGLNTDQFFNFALFVIIGGILGGRISSLLIYSRESFFANPLTFFSFWDGGISIIGALPLGILAGGLYCRIRRFPFRRTLALVSPCVMASQAAGRIGCFLNGDGFGTSSTLPWAVRFPKFGHFFPSFQPATGHPTPAWQWSLNKGLIDPSSPVSAPIHPTALYESFGVWLLLVAALFLIRESKKRGWSEILVVCLHLGGYSLIRFFVEFFRADRETIAAVGLSALQIVLLAAFALCVGAAVFLFLKGKREVLPGN